ncbi:MAG: trp operon repressor [Deltaproteobacteria bacterium]|jgi:TrpR family trp operon transcriptional repressor|nr:trp operon repressor [Deltaproteobacteria bacterium]MCW8893149.1 trp operon repressor [Deltaproteobacteria bacterium]MCW9050563.1 trp operon repressor [Deltaproteobacteria bacterium]
MDANIKYIAHLVNHLLAQESPVEMEKALRDLLTSSELVDVANRLQIFEMLEQGVPQRKIADKLGVGIATVTRGSNALKKRAGY